MGDLTRMGVAVIQRADGLGHALQVLPDENAAEMVEQLQRFAGVTVVWVDARDQRHAQALAEQRLPELLAEVDA